MLTYFVYFNLSFNRGRAIHTKTIFHEKSLKNGYNEWLHPDMVGFYLPLKEWAPVVIDLNRMSDNNAIRLFSFELKKSLNKSNYRESFFQAVSNSSWAHEGYLVAVEIMQDNDFLAELERLAASFGIGIIQIDPVSIATTRAFSTRPESSRRLTGKSSTSSASRIRISENFFRTSGSTSNRNASSVPNTTKFLPPQP